MVAIFQLFSFSAFQLFGLAGCGSLIPVISLSGAADGHSLIKGHDKPLCAMTLGVLTRCPKPTRLPNPFRQGAKLGPLSRVLYQALSEAMLQLKFTVASIAQQHCVF